MPKEEGDFEYLVTVTEESRLDNHQKYGFVMFLLDAPPAKLAAIATMIRKDEDGFEIYAMNTVSNNKILRKSHHENKFLTYDEILIKKAMTGKTE